MWTIEQIEELGFKLVQNEKLWCRFKGHGYEVSINLDTKQVTGNHFNFHSQKGLWKGHFSACINTPEEFKMLLGMLDTQAHQNKFWENKQQKLQL